MNPAYPRRRSRVSAAGISVARSFIVCRTSIVVVSDDEIVEKMVTGRFNTFLKEITLLGQPFVKDPDLSVAKLLDSKGAKVTAFVRFEVGEGIEKKEENFADEVMKQIEDAKKPNGKDQ